MGDYPEKYDQAAADACDAYDNEYRVWRTSTSAYLGKVWLMRLEPSPLTFDAGEISDTAVEIRYLVDEGDADTIRRHAAMRAALDSVRPLEPPSNQ